MIPLALCISSFLVAVTKQHDQGNLQKERLCSLMGQRDKSLSWWGNMAADGSRMLGAGILSHKQEAKRVNWEWFQTLIPPSPTPVTSFLLSLSKQPRQLGPDIQMPGSMRTFSFKPA